jgi:hypothetical protein
MSVRILLKVSPRQSRSSLILASITREGDSIFGDGSFFFFMTSPFFTRVLASPLDSVLQPPFGNGSDIPIVLFKHQHVPIAFDADLGEANEAHG